MTVLAQAFSESTMNIRKFDIQPKDLEKFGNSPGCKKCQSYMKGTTLSSTVEHSEACRQRIMIEFAKIEGGRARIAKVDEKTDQYLADRVAEGDQRTAQGWIDTVDEAYVRIYVWLRIIMSQVAAQDKLDDPVGVIAFDIMKAYPYMLLIY